MRKSKPPKQKKPDPNTHVKTKLGWLERLGSNPWGKPLVKCPQCGQLATAGKSGDVWCRACGFDTATLIGCT